MGRPRTVDRDRLLDSADAGAGDIGAAALPFDAVAKAAGVIKSGVQRCFGTKQVMIDAILARWEAEFDWEVAQLVGKITDPINPVCGHIEATMAAGTRSSVTMAALIQSPRRREAAQERYRRRLEKLGVSTASGRRARLAFLIFMLRCFGLMEVSESEQRSIFTDFSLTADRPSRAKPMGVGVAPTA